MKNKDLTTKFFKLSDYQKEVIVKAITDYFQQHESAQSIFPEFCPIFRKVHSHFVKMGIVERNSA